MFGLKHDFLGTQASEIGDLRPVRGYSNTKTRRHKGIKTPEKTQRDWIHALRLFRKRLALISEAPCAYFGSAPCLFRKRPALIPEAPRAYFGGAPYLFWRHQQLKTNETCFVGQLDTLSLPTCHVAFDCAPCLVLQLTK